MQISDDLFLLIKSLDKSEKRYFKLYASRHILKGESIQIQLFDAIESQEIYDEAKILNKFKDKNFVKHISTTKNKLYSLLLKSLDAYYSSNPSVEVEIRELLNQIDVLKQKKLYEQCLKLITKAKKLTQTYEKPLEYLKLLDIESKLSRIINVKTNFEQKEKSVLEIQKEEFNLVEKYKNYLDFKVMSNQGFLLLEKGDTKKYSDDFSDTLGNEDFRKNAKPILFQAKVYFNTCCANYLSLQNKNTESHKFTANLVELWESNPELIKETPYQYLIALYNHGIACRNNKKINELEAIIKLIKSLNEQKWLPENLKVQVFEFSLELNILLHLYLAWFEKLYNSIDELEEKFKFFGSKLNKKFIIFFILDFAYVCFVVGDFKKALFFLNKLLNETEKETQQNLQTIAKVLSLAIHFELGNYEILEHSAKSVFRFLKQKKELSIFDKAFLAFFEKQLPETKNKKDVQKLFVELSKKLEKVRQQLNLQGNQYYIALCVWVKSKAEAKPFIELLKEERKKRN
ncbi:hypothetical protein IT568_04050 [bacterium]|nr:hypothetical protein [bacterium]